MHLVSSCDSCTEPPVSSPQLASQPHTKRRLPGLSPEAEVEGVEQEDPEKAQPAAESDGSRWRRTDEGEKSCHMTSAVCCIDWKQLLWIMD